MIIFTVLSAFMTHRHALLFRYAAPRNNETLFNVLDASVQQTNARHDLRRPPFKIYFF